MSVRRSEKESQAKQSHEQARTFIKLVFFQSVTSDIQCTFKSKTTANKRRVHRKHLKLKKASKCSPSSYLVSWPISRVLYRKRR